MTTLRLIGDVVGLLAFAAAAAVVVVTPTIERVRVPVTKWLFALACGLYAVVAASDVATDIGLTNALHPFEDYIEALVPLVVLGILFAKRSEQRYAELARTRRALQRSHDLMLDIIDGAPAGIMFLDPGGRVAFANEVAKGMFGLVEDGPRTLAKDPSWTLSGTGGASEPGDLSALARPEPYDAMPFALKRPNGGSQGLRVSGRPLTDQSGEFGGAVVTFETV